jgi:sulfur carrier protein ThiS
LTPLTAFFIVEALMLITLLPQHKEVQLDGRRRVADILRHLGLLPGTVMVIRGSELACDDEVVEADESIEIRNVISGG